MKRKKKKKDGRDRVKVRVNIMSSRRWLHSRSPLEAKILNRVFTLRQEIKCQKERNQEIRKQIVLSSCELIQTTTAHVSVWLSVFLPTSNPMDTAQGSSWGKPCLHPPAAICSSPRAPGAIVYLPKLNCHLPVYQLPIQATRVPPLAQAGTQALRAPPSQSCPSMNQQPVSPRGRCSIRGEWT